MHNCSVASVHVWAVLHEEGRQQCRQQSVLAALQVGCCHVEGIVAEMEKQGYEAPSQLSIKGGTT